MSAIPRDTRTYSAPSLLDRALNLSWVNLELVLFGLLMVASVIAHLWHLDVMAMHHDDAATAQPRNGTRSFHAAEVVLRHR